MGNLRLEPALIVLLIAASLPVWGCSRRQYRLAADREVYHTIAERNGDPRWSVDDVSVRMDPRSRYYEPYDPDRPPMPPDDPAAHRYMHCVDGMRGWEHWDDFGFRPQLENPQWKSAIAEYAPLDDDGNVRLDLPTALQLAYIHSPEHQRQLETLYLSSLDVTTERFRFDVQYFGGYDVTYSHDGSLVPATLTYDSILNRYVITRPTQGIESNRLTIGKPSGADPALEASRRFATAGQLLAGFANSFVFEFTGSDANLSASLLNFSFLQPLLRGAGRDVALEQLTFLERNLLANLRSYSQFRQGFYTLVALGELGVSGPQRGGLGTSLQIFSGQGFLGGYVGLLQQLQQIRNAEDNLALQLRTLARLELLLDAGLIDLVQVDQFRQSVESQRADLLQRRNSYLLSLDTYKTRTLGLPPDLPVVLNDELILQFQFVDRDATSTQDKINELQDRLGLLEEETIPPEIVAEIQSEAAELMPELQQRIEAAIADLETMKQIVPERMEELEETAAEQFALEIGLLDQARLDLESKYGEAESLLIQLQTIDMDDETSLSNTIILLQDMLRIVQSAILVQARSRLESVTIDEIALSSEDAFQIALANRLDFMNARASLVDSWRLIQVNADALQSVLNVSASGEMRTAKNNPVNFRGATSNVQLGLQFDAPLTRLVERNAYRESLIDYQRNRRAFIQSRDALHQGLRVLLRQIELLKTNLEIQRRAVAIAIRRVDATRAELDEPVPPPQPGQRANQFGPTSAFNLLSAQSALQDTQNAFLAAWLNYYAAKMRLARELGIMSLDADGRWIETSPPTSAEGYLQMNAAADFVIESVGESDESETADPLIDELPTGQGVEPLLDQGSSPDGNSGQATPPPSDELPPPVPEDLFGTVEQLPENFTFRAPSNVAPDHESIVNEAALIE